jgi:CheY-like chemotaxis protein
VAAPHQHTVFVVDDDKGVREAMEVLLITEGLGVVTACDGQDALDRLRAGLRPCVILLDLMMPKIDGWAFLHMQRADPALATIPVIAFSAYDRLLAQAAQLDVAAALPKPVMPETLLRLVDVHCPVSAAH